MEFPSEDFNKITKVFNLKSNSKILKENTQKYCFFSNRTTCQDFDLAEKKREQKTNENTNKKIFIYSIFSIISDKLFRCLSKQISICKVNIIILN